MAEMAIQQLLHEAGAEDIDQDLGYGQSSGFASQTRARFDRAHRYAATPRLPLNS